MRTYIRRRVSGGLYFFTVNLAVRKQNDLLIQQVNVLREACRYTQRNHPFRIDAMVVLPEHLHYNPVKHGYVSKPADWPHSSFSRWVKIGVYSPDWAASPLVIEQNWG